MGSWSRRPFEKILAKTKIPSLVRETAEIKEAALKKYFCLARYRDLDKVDMAAGSRLGLKLLPDYRDTIA